MLLELDTLNKTVTLKSQSFKLDELNMKLQELGLTDWTIIINTYVYNQFPYYYGNGLITTSGNYISTNCNTAVPVGVNCTFTR